MGVGIKKCSTSEESVFGIRIIRKMLDDGFDKGQKDLFYIKGHVLPDMAENIKCGNSLIGFNFFDDHLEIDSNEMKKIKPFDWQQQFSEVFESGGFDCVIGNPPYIRSESLGRLKSYFQKIILFMTNQPIYFFIFTKKASILLKERVCMASYQIISIKLLGVKSLGCILKKYPL